MTQAPLPIPETAAQVDDPETIRKWLVSALAAAMEVPESAIDTSAQLSSFGLDSIKAFSLTGDLAEWLDQDLPATLLWDHPTIDALVGYIVDQLDSGK